MRRSPFAQSPIAPLAFVPLLLASLLVAVPASLRAQSQALGAKISSLFVFGPGQEPLFLAGSADPSNPASIQVHGTHFIPSSQAENGSIISFITGAISANVANSPIGSSSGDAATAFPGPLLLRQPAVSNHRSRRSSDTV